MDENLYFGKEFKDNLFNNYNMSFGFIFIKSSLLREKHNKILESLWTKFINEINGSISKVQVKIIENKLEPNIILEIAKMFVISYQEILMSKIINWAIILLKNLFLRCLTKIKN